MQTIKKQTKIINNSKTKQKAKQKKKNTKAINKH